MESELKEKHGGGPSMSSPKYRTAANGYKRAKAHTERSKGVVRTTTDEHNSTHNTQGTKKTTTTNAQELLPQTKTKRGQRSRLVTLRTPVVKDGHFVLLDWFSLLAGG